MPAAAKKKPSKSAKKPALIAQEAVHAAVPAHPYPVGENVFIRTVTCYYTGHLARVTAGEIVLTDAAWVADTGRFSVALATGKLHEVEPYPDGEVVVSRAGVTDATRWLHALPRKAV